MQRKELIAETYVFEERKGIISWEENISILKMY